MNVTTSRGMDRRSAKAKRAAGLKTRRVAQRAALEFLNYLHDADFRTLWLESMQMFSDGHYYIKIIVPDDEINAERLMKLSLLADSYGAKVSLSEVWFNSIRASRITVWVKHS